MSSITIVKTDLTQMDTDCIVNAANSRLAMGGGVCADTTDSQRSQPE